MTRHLLDEVLDRQAAAAAARANPVITWLRSPAGEAWSRIAHHGGSSHPADQPQTLWRATGPLDVREDPAGAPPIARRTT